MFSCPNHSRSERRPVEQWVKNLKRVEMTIKIKQRNQSICHQSPTYLALPLVIEKTGSDQVLHSNGLNEICSLTVQPMFAAIREYGFLNVPT